LYGLPEALIHPDPVMKNLISTPRNEKVLIDWTGAGWGPRVVSLAVLIWSGALVKGSWSPQNVNAIVSGYRKHIQLEHEELERLSGAMIIRQLVFTAWRYRYAITSGQAITGSEWWWPSEVLTQAVSAKARSAFELRVQKSKT
jgi:Ser/Thr protein kinase RdoA (MazF antagonist)